MKNFILLCFTLLPLSIFAGPIKGNTSFKDYDEAKKEGHLTWTVESTKIGLFSSDVDGYVLNYNYSADLDNEQLILRNMKLSFPITAMNSDNESRDEKLHNKCLGSKEFNNIEVSIEGPIFLKEHMEREYSAIIKIRGKDKNFTIKITPTNSENGFKLKGTSVLSLKGLEIPDPSIAVAKLSDEIKLNISLAHQYSK